MALFKKKTNYKKYILWGVCIALIIVTALATNGLSLLVTVPLIAIKASIGVGYGLSGIFGIWAYKEPKEVPSNKTDTSSYAPIYGTPNVSPNNSPKRPEKKKRSNIDVSIFHQKEDEKDKNTPSVERTNWVDYDEDSDKTKLTFKR